MFDKCSLINFKTVEMKMKILNLDGVVWIEFLNS